MITKEDCRLLYNIYSQIETTESIISDLENFVRENGGKVPDVIDCDYKTYGSIQISIPHFEEGKFKCGSATVYKIRYDSALLVLKDHVYNLRKQAKELSDKLEKGGSNEQTMLRRAADAAPERSGNEIERNHDVLGKMCG